MDDTSARAEGDAQDKTLEKQNEIAELEAEEESAKAMDADVPQPADPSPPDEARED